MKTGSAWDSAQRQLDDAAREMRDELKGKRVGVIVSGGNVDIGRFASFLAG